MSVNVIWRFALNLSILEVIFHFIFWVKLFWLASMTLLCSFSFFIFLKDDMAGSVHISSKQRTALKLRNGVKKKREFSVFETFIRKHGNDTDNSSIFIQFQLDEPEWGWSGPLCISSLGRFFLKFRKKVNQVTDIGTNEMQFAAVCVAEEGSTLVVQFYRPPNVSLPYRIENRLRGASITFYQKVVYVFHIHHLLFSNSVCTECEDCMC